MKLLPIDLDTISIKPITNELEFKEASEIIDALIDADMIEDTETRQKALEVLAAITTIAIEYEKKHHPISVSS